MKVNVRNGIWLAAVLVGTTLLPGWTEEQPPLPSASGQLTFTSPASGEIFSMNVQARMVHQGALVLPAGTVLVNWPGGQSVAYEVTGLQVSRVETNGVLIAMEAEITAENRETGKTVRLHLYNEQPAAAQQLPPDYHQPFPPGDCVTSLQVEDQDCDTVWLQQSHHQVEIKAPASQPGS
jgi:hypothetical protein